MDGPEGLKIYELVEGGKGDPIKKGDKVIVHYGALDDRDKCQHRSTL